MRRSPRSPRADAIEPLQKAFDLVDQIAAKDPNDATFRDRVGTAGLQLGDVLRHIDPRRAISIYARTLQRLRETHDGTALLRQARVLAHSACAYERLGRWTAAQQAIDSAFAILKPMGQDPAVVGMLGGEWDDAYRARADYEFQTGHPERSRAILLDLQDKLLALDPTPETDLRNAFDMSRLYASLYRDDVEPGRLDEAKHFQALRIGLWTGWDHRLPGNQFVRRQVEAASRR
ncbi:MAG: hypothetical protein LAO79_19450 [Acidobacteriia bacterium]|nr:hypothetical protein [Terriglobia bacterium]